MKVENRFISNLIIKLPFYLINGSGSIINIIWIVSAFLQPPISSTIFLTIGFFGLALTPLTRLFTRLKSTSQYAEIEGGGSIVGFVIACIITNFFYPLSTDTVFLLNANFEVNYVIQLYIVIVFLVWFVIPTSPNQELIFGLPPLFSYFILNFWKLLILLKFFIQIQPQFASFSPTINLIIILFAYSELILLLLRQKRIDIVSIILDIRQVLMEVFRGPGQALKWSFIIIFFLIFQMVPSDIWMLSVIAFSLIIGFISFSAMVTRVGINSGIFASKFESGKSLVPTIFNEISHIEPENLYQNFYKVNDPFLLKINNKIIRFEKNSILFRIPLPDTLENAVGVYIATIDPKQLKLKLPEGLAENEKVPKNLSVNFSLKSVKKFSFNDWKTVKTKAISLQSEEVITTLGFKSQEEFNEKVQKGLVGITDAQEQIRARIRGLPVVSRDPDKYTVVWNGDSHLTIPQEIVAKMSEKNASVLEIIAGKEEYLFYVKIR